MIGGASGHVMCKHCGSILPCEMSPSGVRTPVSIDIRVIEESTQLIREALAKQDGARGNVLGRAKIREALITQPAAERAVLGRKL